VKAKASSTQVQGKGDKGEGSGAETPIAQTPREGGSLVNSPERSSPRRQNKAVSVAPPVAASPPPQAARLTKTGSEKSDSNDESSPAGSGEESHDELIFPVNTSAQRGNGSGAKDKTSPGAPSRTDKRVQVKL
jgi:hypothetical protein